MGWFGYPKVLKSLKIIESDRHDYQTLMKQMQAFEVLGRSCDTRAIEPIGRYVHRYKQYDQISPDRLTALHLALEALSMIGGEQCETILIDALTSRWTAHKARELLDRRAFPDAIDRLLKRLKEKTCPVAVADGLDLLGWKPANDEEKSHYYIAKSELSKLAQLHNPVLDPLLDRLDNHPDPAEIFQVLETIGNNAAIEVLREAMKRSDLSIQRRALDALERIKNEEAVDCLIQTLKTGEENLTIQAANALIKIGDDKVVKDLVSELLRGGRHVSATADVLEKLKWHPNNDEEKIYFLVAKKNWDELQSFLVLTRNPLAIKALTEDFPFVDSHSREKAIDALAAIETPEAVNALLGSYKNVKSFNLSDIINMSESGISFLQSKFGPDAVERLLKYRLQDYLREIGVPPLRASVINALAKMGTSEAVDALFNIYEDNLETNISEKEIAYVKKFAPEMVTKYVDRCKAEVLDTRCSVIEAAIFNMLQKPKNILIIRRGQWDKDKNIKTNAEEAVNSFKLEDLTMHILPLIEAVKDKDEDDIVRLCCMELLGKLKTDDILEFFLETARDTSKSVRSEAIRILGEYMTINKFKGYNIRFKDLLMKTAKDTSAMVRSAALQNIVAYPYLDDELIRILTEALKDEDDEIRGDTARQLVERRVSSAFEEVLESIRTRRIKLYENSFTHDIQLLINTKDRRFIEVVLDHIFENISSHEVLDNIKAVNWFLDYTNIIFDARSYEQEKPVVTWKSQYDSNTQGMVPYSLSKSDEAIDKLCEIGTPVSSNILHHVSRKKDVEVVLTWSCSFRNWGFLSFENQRQKAFAELERRGNPPYDPTLNVNQEAWKLL